MVDDIKIIAPGTSGVLATRNGDRLDTRVFQALFVENGRVYFCTSSEKTVYGQLKKYPYASFCTYPQDFAPVLTLNGKVEFVEEQSIKARVLNENAMAKRNYITSDNPVFQVFYIEVEEEKTYSFAEGTKRNRLK